jgi:hypothetical protein
MGHREQNSGPRGKSGPSPEQEGEEDDFEIDNIALAVEIELEGVTPRVWRKIELPVGANFWELHVAIQDSMGWEDSHLHVFLVTEPFLGVQYRIGIPDDTGDLPDFPGWATQVLNWLRTDDEDTEIGYVYDFGDDWTHRLKVHLVPCFELEALPRCVEGGGICPPEDCGGRTGYVELIAALSDPKHPEHASLREWVGPDFDPAAVFDAESVGFTDPDDRWENAFLD